MSKQKNIILFDVDGTIAESSKIIDPEIKELVSSLKEFYDVGIVGGGKKDKILHQLENLYVDHYFFECGCVYYKNMSEDKKNLVLQNYYSKNIRNHPLYEKINLLVKECLLFLSKVDYTLSGNFIDLRNGMLYISLIGMSATNEERQYFIEKNNKNNYRKQLLNILLKKAKELGIQDEVTICEGGTVGLAIYPLENDKIQVLEHLQDYKEIHYFGDKYEENGNDHNIINDSRTIGYPIDNLQMTKDILRTLLLISK